jgi:hypothetical protein
VTQCNIREFTKRFSILPPEPRRDRFGGEASIGLLDEKLIDFLDGRTHGEELLHALYDRVLDEPIPERMRALFKRPAKKREGA